jgi:tRNA A37 threonylcarbamoyladenosine modification protein TsaB
MRLLLKAQDIASITYGLVASEELVQEETVMAQPEGYLAVLDGVLSKWQIGLDDLKGILVVTGPGSFTASRVSTTIANTLGFTLNIAVVGVENSSHLPLRELLEQKPKPATPFVFPTYDQPPLITIKKKEDGDNIKN